jgi:hypothetical protein
VTSPLTHNFVSKSYNFYVGFLLNLSNLQFFFSPIVINYLIPLFHQVSNPTHKIFYYIYFFDFSKNI